MVYVGSQRTPLPQVIARTKGPYIDAVFDKCCLIACRFWSWVRSGFNWGAGFRAIACWFQNRGTGVPDK